MSAEAEVSDIILRVSMEGVQYLLRFSGAATEKMMALFFAGIKTAYSRTKGRQKLGGKISPRAFLSAFVASTVFPLQQEDFNKLKPEMKRLHIPYMQYKTTDAMKQDGRVEISVSKEDADRFVRLAESLGIAAVTPYEAEVDELTPSEYEQALKDGTAKGVDVAISDDGITVNERENPSPAPTDPLNQSAPNSKESEPFIMRFDPTASIDQNLQQAETVAKQLSGELIPISINREALLQSEAPDKITVIVPGTQKTMSMEIPRRDIINPKADNGKTILVNLRARATYVLKKLNINQMPTESIVRTGKEIRDAKWWDTPSRAPRKRTPKAPSASVPKIPTIKGGK